MAKINVMLDDTRLPNPKWAWIWLVAATPFEFYSLIIHNIGNIENITFDHDLGYLPLGGREITGYDCLAWFVQTYKFLEIPFPCIWIETSNPVGAQQMENLLSYEWLEFQFPYRWYPKWDRKHT